MSERGQRLFDRYVAHYLNDMPLAAIGLESHVHNFIEQAHNRSIPINEVTDEVGHCCRRSRLPGK